MGHLSFVGLGLGYAGLTFEGAEELRAADLAYLEYYTTPHEPRLLDYLARATGKQLVVVDRGFVEDGTKILLDAAGGRVALAVLGDPMIATTHNELRTRAIRQGIETKVVHAATIASAAGSASGLHYYKFAKTVTVTRETVSKLTNAYRVVHQNLLSGSHSLLLLEYDVQSGEGVTPGEAAEGLLHAEENLKRNVVGGDTFALVVSRLGRGDARMFAGTLGAISRMDFGEPPHCVVIPGSMHFTEVEAVSAIFDVKESDVKANSDGLRRTAETLVPRYVAKTKKALEAVRQKLEPRYGGVVQNAELYVRDAENFLANGEDELAMLSVGYAEGLLDSLSFSGVVAIDW